MRGSRKRAAIPQSKYRDWYVWSKKKPPNAKDGVVFPGVQKSTWTYDKEARRWYFHRFYDFQPDLNTANPYVQAEIAQDHGFLDPARRLGIPDGRRALRHRDQGRARSKSRSSSTTCCATFREFLQWREGDAIILAEANVLPDTDMQYFGDEGERLQMMFNFQVNQNTFYALASADTGPLKKALLATQAAPGDRAVGRVPAQPRRARSRTPRRRNSAKPCSPRSARTPTCNSTSAGSAGGSRPCSTATGVASNSPTA